MNILFMVDYWKPVATTNAVCAYHVMKELQKKGHQIYVSTYSDLKECPNKIDGIQIESVRPTYARRVLNYAKYAHNPKLKRVASFLGKTLNRCRRILLLPFYPVVSFSFSRRWSKQVGNMIRKHNIDAIVSVIAPEDALYTGYCVKRLCPSVKWIPYYLDNGSNVLPGDAFEAFKQTIKKKAIRWENRILLASSGMIVMKGHEHHYREALSAENQKKLFVANVPLFLKVNQPKAHGRNTAERWMYAGSMTGRYYEPEVIVAFFEEYRKVCNAELHLFGLTDKTEYLKQMSSDAASGITWHGMVSHDELYREYEKSDVLVYYKKGTLDSVSGKFFEYIQYGKPVIYIGADNDINAELVKRYAKGIVIPESFSSEIIADLPYEIQNVMNTECEDFQLYETFKESRPQYTASLIEHIIC